MARNRAARCRTPGIYHAQVAMTTFSLEGIVEADALNR
jgi:hypothetical protein